MKPETQKKILSLIKSGEDVEDTVAKIKALIKEDGTVTPKQAEKLVKEYMASKAVNSDDLKAVVNDYITLCKHACKAQRIAQVKGLRAEYYDGIIVYAITANGEKELDFEELLEAVPQCRAILTEAETLIKSVNVDSVISAINGYGKEPKSVMGTKIAQALAKLGKCYVADNGVENAKGLVVKYSDGILDLYLKTSDGYDEIDLEELVGEDETRHALLNVIFADGITEKDIRIAAELLKKFSF